MTLALDSKEMAAEVSAGRRMFTLVRVKTVRHILNFLRAPLGWVLLATLVYGTWWYSTIRVGNFRACAATATTMDQQQFRDVVAGNSLPGGAAFARACAGMAVVGPNWAELR